MITTKAIDRPYLQSGKDEIFGNNVIAHIFSINRFIFLLGTTVILKESVDPITDKILKEEEITSDEKHPAVTKENFGIELLFDVNFINRAKTLLINHDKTEL